MSLDKTKTVRCTKSTGRIVTFHGLVLADDM